MYSDSVVGLVVLCGALAHCFAEQKQEDELVLKNNVTEEMHLITKSLEDLLGELAIIKKEATGRLSNVKNRASTSEQERIRQTKVSRFVLKRVAELEIESEGMKEDLNKLFSLKGKQPSANSKLVQHSEAKQEDLDFDEQTSTTSRQKETSTSEGMPATTIKPEDEAAKIGFDMEALKKLGEEIGKRLDQFGKDAAKNIADLFDGIKLVFREPKDKSTKSTTPTTIV